MTENDNPSKTGLFFCNLFLKTSPFVALLIPFFIPIRLSLTYAVLIPTLLLWLNYTRKDFVQNYKENRLLQILHVFIFVSLLSSVFGLAPMHSLYSILSLLFFSLTIPLFSDLTKRYSASNIILALLCGQSIAALHSVIEAGSGKYFGRTIIGAVSESGQLALTIPTALAILYIILHKDNFSGQKKFLYWFESALSILILALTAFASRLHIPNAVFYTLSGIVGIATLMVIFNIIKTILKKDSKNIPAIFVTMLFFLTIMALLVNLKRGPWFGVIMAFSVFLFVFKRRLIVPLGIGVITIFLAITPLRDRVSNSVQDFKIAGGRRIMWKVGTELTTRYPLGIGYNNSKELRRFASEIPQSHQHFHNNYINILVECGWLAFAVFIFWLITLLKTSFSNINNLVSKETIIKVGLGSAFTSMMCAGLVEYNFGDSEVCLLFFMLIGVLSGLVNKDKAIS